MIVKLVKFFIKELSELRTKKIITEVPLYCIASFIIGAYTVLLVNFFYFDNHITPPGVSAFVASMALLFTVYAALMVKNWSEQKMNDKAFKHAEDVIESANECYLDFVIGSMSLITLLENEHNIDLYEDNLMISEYLSKHDAYKFKAPQIVHRIEVLRVWKYKTNHMQLFKNFITSLNTFDNLAHQAIKEIRYSQTQDIQKYKDYAKQLQSELDAVITSFQKLMNLSFDQLFIPIK